MCLEAAGRAWRLLLSLLQTRAAFLSVKRLDSRALPHKEAPKPILSTSGVTAQLPQHGPTVCVLTVVFKMICKG